MSGVEKEIDNLGRVVLPVSFRNKLGLRGKDKVLVRVNEASIIILPLEMRCALCGKKITKEAKIRLCRACLDEVRAFDEV